MSAKDKLEKCFKEGEMEKERHQGLRKIKIDRERINNHLRKAEHNLNSMVYLKKGGFSDWSASAAFYTLYHCLLALTAKNGYESRNQKCTFAFIEDLIEKGKIKYITKEDLEEIFDKSVDEDLEHSDKIQGKGCSIPLQLRWKIRNLTSCLKEQKNCLIN